MEIFKGMLDRQKKLEGFFKEKKDVSLYNSKEKLLKGNEQKERQHRQVVEIKAAARALERRVLDKESKSSSLIKTVKDELKYESLIKSEQAKLKQEEIHEFATETKQRH